MSPFSWPKPMQTEFGIHPRLESCGDVLLFCMSIKPQDILHYSLTFLKPLITYWRFCPSFLKETEFFKIFAFFKRLNFSKKLEFFLKKLNFFLLLTFLHCNQTSRYLVLFHNFLETFVNSLNIRPKSAICDNWNFLLLKVSSFVVFNVYIVCGRQL